jgi:DNA-binding beta-propeller fold protein YncE
MTCSKKPQANLMRTLHTLMLIGVIVTAHAESLTLTRTIPLPNVGGRIDHLAIDPEGHWLFVAALGNNTVEVVDLQAGKVVRSIAGFSEPQGVCYVREFNRLYVANGGDGAVRVFDGTTYAPGIVIKFEDDADNIRYDATAKLLYVGYGSGAVGVVDATKNVIVGDIPLEAHPESFQLEQAGARVFINVPGAHTIIVADRNTRKVTGKWALGMVAANFPLALDEASHRAFVCCRTPARLLVYDTQSGTQVAKLDLHGDCDDVFYNAATHEIYASCGEGFIDVFTATDADHFRLKDAVATVAKARTCFFDGNQIYLAVPRRSESPAEIRFYVPGR